MQRLVDRALSVVVALASVVVIGAGVERWLVPLRPTPRSEATTRPPAAPIPQDPVRLEGLPAIGSSLASVQFLEVSDFSCPYCARFDATTWPRLRQEFIETGLVRSVFLASPDPNKPFAEEAAALAVCMAADLSFGEIRTALFSAPRPFTDQALAGRAATLGLAGASLDRCRTGSGLLQVRAQRRLAETLFVPGTPTFYVGLANASDRNTMRVLTAITGLRPYEEFAAAIRTALHTQ